MSATSDADGANATQKPASASAGDNHHVPDVNSPKLRRRSGSEDMSSLRIVNNVSPDAQRRQLTLDDTLPTSSTTPDTPAPVDQRLMSSAASPVPASVFDIAEESQEELSTEGTEVAGEARALRDGDGDGDGDGSGDDDERDSYNLKPPPTTRTLQLDNSLEALSDRLFSRDHLDVILHDYALASRFSRFLQAYRPAQADILKQYVASRKATVAVHFANAVAGQMQSQIGSSSFVAAKLDARFETQSLMSAKALVDEALPAYLTHRLVNIVTDTLTKEITGNSLPLMTTLIPSLAEVYCISDPSVQDNPIIYASEEFYNITQYSKEFIIGRNCRFLQGPKSSEAAVTRLIQAVARGEECCETILNYKRDGTPFWNLLMIAPLYDNKGAVRYFLGCQIDVSSLIEGGRGLESFAQLLAQDRAKARAPDFSKHLPTKRDPQTVLEEFGQLLTEEEADIVKNRAQSANSVPSDQGFGPMTSSPRNLTSRNGSRSNRIVLGVDSPGPGRQLWPSATLGPSGRLPGVYQNYLLVRPYPSLRITFTSPSLRIPGLLQTKLLDRIGATSVREGLANALSQSQGVTAKVNWLTSSSNAAIEGGRTRWLHCTPLLGSDERVGVWMVVICEDESSTSTGSLKSGGEAQTFTSNKLYADYLKRESRDSRPGTAQTNGSSQAKDDQFADF